jgi:hypothetical protein
MSDKTTCDETLRFLITQKMSYVNSTVNVCMQWWVSSIVFCGAVLAAVWSNRVELRQPGILIGLGIILFAFFSVISYFGFSVAHRLGIVQQEIAVLADKLHYADLEPTLKPLLTYKIRSRNWVSRWLRKRRSKSAKLAPIGGFFYTEIITFKRSMIFGACSFGLICLAWIFLWGLLWSQRNEKTHPVGSNQFNQRAVESNSVQAPPNTSPNSPPQ